MNDQTQRWTWPSRRDYLIFWPLALGGMVLDLWTKHLAFKHISFGESVDIIPGFLRFHLALNDGAAFSMASGNRVFLVGIAGVALVVLLGIFFFGGKRSLLMTVALGLFMGGVAGNFYDRAFYRDGLVRDFVDMYVGGYHWPTYNVADALLCFAVGLLMISTLKGTEKQDAEEENSQSQEAVRGTS